MTDGARGRPRSEQTKRAILAAARDLIAESGYEQLTIQAIAARARSGRRTVYRWWTSKALILAELVMSGDLALPKVVIPDTGSLEADLTRWLDEAVVSFADRRRGSLMRALVTAASDDEVDARLLYGVSTAPSHQALVDRLMRGVAVGQVGAHSDPTAIAEALIGIVLFRGLTPGASPAPTSAVIQTLLGKSAPQSGRGRSGGTSSGGRSSS
jgi:AcrR family transcriptional regulator